MFFLNRINRTAIAAILLSSVILGGAVEAKPLKFAIGHPPSSFIVQAGKKYVDSPGALADLYWEEVYSKVDVSKHGL